MFTHPSLHSPVSRAIHFAEFAGFLRHGAAILCHAAPEWSKRGTHIPRKQQGLIGKMPRE